MKRMRSCASVSGALRRSLRQAIGASRPTPAPCSAWMAAASFSAVGDSNSERSGSVT